MFIAGSTPSDTKVTVAGYAGSQWHLSADGLSESLTYTNAALQNQGYMCVTSIFAVGIALT
jgi:hypothetical protein